MLLDICNRAPYTPVEQYNMCDAVCEVIQLGRLGMEVSESKRIIGRGA